MIVNDDPEIERAKINMEYLKGVQMNLEKLGYANYARSCDYAAGSIQELLDMLEAAYKEMQGMAEDCGRA